ncbi:MAG: YraN family protein [Opitutales bacterium]
MKLLKRLYYYCKFLQKYVRNANVRKGFRGEQAAARYLRKSKYRILERNWTFGIYEVDMIAEKNNCLVFVEVRGRSETSLQSGFDSVNRRKKQALRMVIKHYLRTHRTYLTYRFDIISITWSSTGKIRSLNHYENVSL